VVSPTAVIGTNCFTFSISLAALSLITVTTTVSCKRVIIVVSIVSAVIAIQLVDCRSQSQRVCLSLTSWLTASDHLSQLSPTVHTVCYSSRRRRRSVLFCTVFIFFLRTFLGQFLSCSAMLQRDIGIGSAVCHMPVPCEDKCS